MHNILNLRLNLPDCIIAGSTFFTKLIDIARHKLNDVIPFLKLKNNAE